MTKKRLKRLTRTGRIRAGEAARDRDIREKVQTEFPPREPKAISDATPDEDAMRARPKTIPDDLRRRVEEAVARFNREELRDAGIRYVPRIRGRDVYLDRSDFEATRLSRICRLRYTGDFDDWEFAIYKYSDSTYDADEWMFPGTEFVDGTVEGAMRAGLAAYPPE